MISDRLTFLRRVALLVTALVLLRTLTGCAPASTIAPQENPHVAG